MNITVESGGTLNLYCSKVPNELNVDTLTVKQIRVVSEDSEHVHVIQSNNDLTATRYITLNDVDGLVPANP